MFKAGSIVLGSAPKFTYTALSSILDLFEHENIKTEIIKTK